MSNSYTLREGFWKPKGDVASSLPPCPPERDKPWKGKSVFLQALARAESNAQQIKYRGFSTCRLCGKTNGTIEMKVSQKGLTVVWPEGYKHYVKVHNVRPSLAFQEFIEKREIK
jgi:hypothetical protein